MTPFKSNRDLVMFIIGGLVLAAMIAALVYLPG